MKTARCKSSDWMKTQMNSSLSDEVGCIIEATDEEEDDLPYDGGITCNYSNHSDNVSYCSCTENIFHVLPCSEDNKKITKQETHLQPEEFSSHHIRAIGTMGISVEIPGSEASSKKKLLTGSFSKPNSKEDLSHSKMSHVLLQHFSKGELISTCKLIECETIPETSFAESTDGSVSQPEPSEQEKHKEVKENTGDKNRNSLNENRCVSKKDLFSTAKCGCQDSPLINENKDTHVLQNTGERTLSPHQFKYDQGQAHYSLLDFSEVSLEAEVPEKNNSAVQMASKAFPFLLSKSLMVNEILENKSYFSPAQVENPEEMRIPEQLQQPEMLSHHADTQNHTDHLRLNPKMLSQSDVPNATAIYSGGTRTASEVFIHAPTAIQSAHGLSKARLQCGTASALPAAGTAEAHCLNPSDLQPELTLGEQMSGILKDQTDQLLKKVEDFSKHVTQETFFLQGNYMELIQLKRYLESLERNYLRAREQHHNLQLQNCKNKSVNVGEFDPERKVEGKIFRLGMLLEDIQEQADDSKYNLSLLTSYEPANSAYSLWESSAVSSTGDPGLSSRSTVPPERRGTETVFPHKKQGEKSQTTDVIPQTNQFSLEDKCNLLLHINAKLQERKTGTTSLIMEKKTTHLSDTNLSSDSEDNSVCDSYSDSQSKELVNSGSDKTFSTSFCGERKGQGCPGGSRGQFELRNYNTSVQCCTLCRNKSSGSSASMIPGSSHRRISTQKSQENKQSCELINRHSERQNFEADKTCYSSTCDKILLSHQYFTSRKSAKSKSAISIRNRNASDSHANILSCTLDHAIQTANSLKRATERMARAVSEDLAKVKQL